MYLVRHGATENNRAKPPRLQGQGIDAALSPEGIKQARRTADFLAPCPLAAVYSSPLLRARQTAEPIAQRHGLAVQVVDDLVEVDIGQWEGMTWDEVQRQYPAEYQAFIADAGIHPYLGGETLENVRARVTPAMSRLLDENLGRAIAVVAHNVVNRAYLAHLIQMPLSLYRMLPQDNCCVNLLRHRNGRTRIVTISSTFHLEDGKIGGLE
ncbi:MAG: histidine phosphatase family protein [Pirellulales bacterium]|nr:histidine phosphatase family protein [Pirellulales bacterium]